MLTTLTRKLCPLMSLAIATIGCGKKIVEAETQVARNTENQELPSAYIIRLDGSKVSRKQFVMTGAATFEIPDRINVKSGNATGKMVEIAYDVNEYDSDDFQFKCTYTASGNPTEMILNNCVNYHDDDLGNITGQEFSVYQNDIIQMKFIGSPATDLVVEAIYSMKWF